MRVFNSSVAEGPMDEKTDERMDKTSYGVACPPLGNANVHD